MNAIYFCDLQTAPILSNESTVARIYHNRTLNDMHLVRVEHDGSVYETLADVTVSNHHHAGFPKRHAAGTDEANELNEMVARVIDKHTP